MVDFSVRDLCRCCHDRFVCVATSHRLGPDAPSAADYYAGKTIRLLLPTGPGGGRALYALPFAEAWSRHIPGNPKIVPVFMPGAGGSTAINNAQNVAAPDGLTHRVAVEGLGDRPGGRRPDRQIRPPEVSLARPDHRRDANLLRLGKGPRARIEELRNHEIIVGAVSRASVTYQNPAFFNRVIGTRLKIVTGYRSAGATNMSVDTGETQGAFTTWNDISELSPGLGA